MRGVALLGSTGSIGESTLRVVARHPERFGVVGLAALRSADALATQVARHHPAQTVLVDERLEAPADWLRGRAALLELCQRTDVDVVVNAIVGFAGLEPTLKALKEGKRLALANKESLVAGGDLVMKALREGGGEIIPIDSEHSAILQCLQGYDAGDVARIVLTASGGPFRGRAPEDLRAVAPGDALRHPTWSMGAKISIDSATLANKALEVIETHYLYGIGYDQIEVVVHPQSIVHSFVEFRDGSVLAQLGYPTMELPILIALAYPERVSDAELQTFDPVAMSSLTFEAVDREAFPLFGLGVGAGRAGGAAPAVFNAANEVAVEAFLETKIGFMDMAIVVEEALRELGSPPVEDLETLKGIDARARSVAHRRVGELGGVRT